MNTKDDEFLRQLRATFRVEAVELLQVIATGLLKLDNMPPLEVQREIVETVFRAVHSLKGASRAVEFAAVESLCQSLEDVFASWKRQKSAPPLETLDTLHRALDAITAILASAEGTGVNYAYPDLSALRTALHKLGTPRPEPATHTPVATTPARFEFTSAETPVGHVPPAAASEKNAAIRETVRVAVPKLESRMLEAEEMVFAKLAARQRVVDLGELADRFSAWRKAWTQIEPEARALRNTRATSAPGGGLDTSGLTQLLDFFDASLLTLKTLESQTAAFAKGAERDRYAVGKLVDDMLEDSKKLLLLPFAAISASLPKLVRDLCRDRGKMADLTVHGEDVEIDKRILEEMKDPLIHLLRNSIDHGIAPPDERIRRGKPARATLTLTLSRVDGGKVQLLLTDDGAGVDTQKVKQSALDLGLIPAGTAEHLSEPEAQALIFQSEVSTSPLVTQLSGRGLGLAIVREKAEKLGGQVTVESSLGRGTTFRIIVPATRGTFRGILVKAAGRVFVVPTTKVERVIRGTSEVYPVEGRKTISFDGRAVILVQLVVILDLPVVGRENAPSAGIMIVLGSGDRRVAFAVDDVLGEQEFLVKPLPMPLSRVRNIAAVTVLGSGEVVPVLNVADLLKSANWAPGAGARAAIAPPQVETETRVQSILLAEDSITSRLLLKEILESAGYVVKTAVDGTEAFSLLHAHEFDLLVSDIEMPRLNGFDLTARIRADKRLAELPVVLVTTLETPEDRERGFDAGADAYIAKSSFDKSDLIEVVRRLL